MRIFNPFSLEGKNIVVTGASSGIGRQCAIDCSRMGAKVVLIARNVERLQETLYAMEGEGHMIVPYDLTDLDDLSTLTASVVERMGRMDGMVHCAGISTVLPLKLLDVSTMEHFFRTNVYSAVQLTRSFCGVKNVNKQGASIIFISSIMACVGENAKSIYSLTKGALVSGVRSLAVEYAKKNIRFNSISPGAIETNINAEQSYMKDPDKRKSFEAKHLLGLGHTSDISYACIYLLSDASRWVTGQNLIVDGGYTSI